MEKGRIIGVAECWSVCTSCLDGMTLQIYDRADS